MAFTFTPDVHTHIGSITTADRLGFLTTSPPSLWFTEKGPIHPFSITAFPSLRFLGVLEPMNPGQVASLTQGHIERQITICAHTHSYGQFSAAIYAWYACHWIVGRNRSTWRKPSQTSHWKARGKAIKPATFLLRWQCLPLQYCVTQKWPPKKKLLSEMQLCVKNVGDHNIK